MPATIQTIQKPTRARALDTSGNNNHGQIYSGRALEFDGVTDYLSVNASVATTPFGAYLKTFACWVKVDNSTTEQVIAAGWLSANSITIESGYIGASSFDDDDDVMTSNTIENNTWYRIVVVSNVDQSDNSAVDAAYADGFSNYDIYINGVKETLQAGNSFRTGGKMLIGARFYDSAFSVYFGGKMSDVQGWNTAWTADDVTYDYLNPEQLALNRGGTSLTNSNLKLWYPMNDGHRGQQSYILDASNTGLGDEMVTNWNNSDFGSLSSSGSDVISAVSDGSGSHDIYADSFSDTIGTSYKVTFTIGGTPGAALKFKLSPESHLGSAEFTSDALSSGSYTLYFNSESTDSTKYVGFRSVNEACDFSVSDFSLKPINQKNHATTVFYGDEMITDAKNRQMTSTPDWDEINLTNGEVSVSSGKLQVVTTTDDEEEGAVLAVAKLTAPVVGRTYRFSAALDSTSGDTTPTIIVSFGGGTASNTISTTEATHNFDIVAINTTGDLRVYTDSTTAVTFTIEDATVKEQGTASGWTDADQQLDIPQTALQSYNQLLWCTASEEDNSMVSVADNSNLDVDDKDFSLSCWIYPVTESDYLPIWRKGAAGSEGYALVVNNSNYIALNINDGSSHNSYANLTDAVVPSGKWSHVVVTCDRSSATGIKCYLNGELQSATDDPTGENEDIGNSSALEILAFSEDDDDSFSGTATEFMLFKDSILTQAEVNELYNDGKALDGTTHSLFSTKCTAYYRNNGLASWPNLATVADSGATSTAAASGTVTNSTETMLITAEVDGTRDSQGFIMNRQRATNSLNLPYNNHAGGYVDLVEETTRAAGSAFSITLWIKPSHVGDNRFIGSGADYIRYRDADELRISANSATDDFTKTSGNWDVDTWMHLGIVRNTSNLVTIYVDGDAQTDTETVDEAFDYRYIGAYDSTNTFNGVIDDVCIYHDELGETEVKRNYNAGKRSHK